MFVAKDGRAEVIAERQNYLLFDRMVSFHVQRGVTVPLSAAEFFEGLARRFPERDGMFFHLKGSLDAFRNETACSFCLTKLQITIGIG